MQQVQASVIRDEVYAKMRQIFNRYTGGRDYITTSQLEKIVRQVLKEQSQTELAYVLNNLCKIDTDSNGSIDFEEFATFLLKRHCGEIALQRMHYNSKMSHGKNRKITPEEFILLLNSAYSFLGISINQAQAYNLFKQADGDRDGLMTYVEYFTFIDQYLCRPLILSRSAIKSKLQTPQPSGLQINSRLRRFIWQELRRLYNNYDKNRSNGLDAEQISNIMRAFIKDITREELDYILFKVLRISGNREVTFIEFASFFLKYMTQVSLSRFYRMNGRQQRLNRQNFIEILSTSFSFLQFSRISVSLLHRFFEKIDTDRDGWITNKEFMDWVELFLCPGTCYGSQYYIQEDDQGLSIGKNSILAQISRAPPVSTVQVTSNVITRAVSPSTTITRVASPSRVSTVPIFKFSSQDLAIKVRERVLYLITQYDDNHNKHFQQPQIVRLLQGILKENPNQIRYVIANVFRYDKDNDRRITYDEMANFLLEMHSGEMAIQRLHMKQTYRRGSQRIMDLAEFALTINYALSFYDIQTDDKALRILFSEIDRNNDGWISYQEYFEFLRYYFGSQSEVARIKSNYQPLRVQKTSQTYVQAPRIIQRIESPRVYESSLTSQTNLILLDSFLTFQQKIRRLFRLQMSSHIFKSDPAHLLTLRQLLPVLCSVFNYKESVLSTLLSPLFSSSSTISFELFMSWMTSTHLDYCIPNFLSRNRLSRQSEQLMNFEEFVKLVEFCFGLKDVKLPRELLQNMFDQLDEDRDGWVGFSQWQLLIKNMFPNNGRVLGERNGTYVVRSDIKGFDGDLYLEIWTELRKLYNFYDTSRNNSLSNQGLELFCRQALLQSSEKELNYIKVSLLRSQPTRTAHNPISESVSFEVFAPFILKHVAETALKRFQMQQPPGKQRMTNRDFTIIMRSAYNFLKSVTSRTDALHKIFQRLDRTSTGLVPYVQFLQWIHRDVAKTVH